MAKELRRVIEVPLYYLGVQMLMGTPCAPLGISTRSICIASGLDEGL
jgi:hypothetical protein